MVTDARVGKSWPVRSGGSAAIYKRLELARLSSGFQLSYWVVHRVTGNICIIIGVSRGGPSRDGIPPKTKRVLGSDWGLLSHLVVELEVKRGLEVAVRPEAARRLRGARAREPR